MSGGGKSIGSIGRGISGCDGCSIMVEPWPAIREPRNVVTWRCLYRGRVTYLYWGTGHRTNTEISVLYGDPSPRQRLVIGSGYCARTSTGSFADAGASNR